MGGEEEEEEEEEEEGKGAGEEAKAEYCHIVRPKGHQPFVLDQDQSGPLVCTMHSLVQNILSDKRNISFFADTTITLPLVWKCLNKDGTTWIECYFSGSPRGCGDTL